jgi:hypothetical protein
MIVMHTSGRLMLPLHAKAVKPSRLVIWVTVPFAVKAESCLLQ